MATLLEIYESFHNGQKKQFARQVDEYSPASFAEDTKTEIQDGVLSESEALAMLQTYLIVKGT